MPSAGSSLLFFRIHFFLKLFDAADHQSRLFNLAVGMAFAFWNLAPLSSASL